MTCFRKSGTRARLDSLVYCYSYQRAFLHCGASAPYLDGGSTQVVASVNGQDITEREFENGYRQFRQRLRDQLGNNYRPELIDDARMRKEFLSSIIRDRLVLQASSDMGFSAGDALVRAYINSIPAFSVGGTFNNEVYERTLRNQGLSPVGFESQVRQSLMTEQLSEV